MNNTETYILEWINRISIAQPELDGIPICPFAKRAKYKIIELLDTEIAPDFSSAQVILYILDENYTCAQLDEIAKNYNKIYPHLVFLPDSKDTYFSINGAQTNNGKYNLLLCQEREELQAARNKLKNTAYYTFWDEDELKEILDQ
jgi:hypothetical protein